jgi:3-phenylpropionate/cinnamic acid dioxygenase small subunit
MARSARDEIRNLLYRYMELTDAGDSEGRASLFEHAVLAFPPDRTVQGRDAIIEAMTSNMILYDGIPRTAHICTNAIIEVDDGAGTATSRSRFVVLQATTDLPLQPIVVGRYHDEFELVDGRWRFSARRFIVDLVGDVSAHQRKGTLLNP